MVGRVGGFSEIQKVIQIAEQRGLLVVPHCWKSGIGIAASAHMAATTECCPYIEFLPANLCDSALRKEIVTGELTMIDGQIPLPKKPGLGVELNPAALRKYADSQVAGRSVIPPGHWREQLAVSDTIST
jgi:L-alanine-DL-glutamate epimerase-like enolase superfamily enzyme